MVNSSRDLVFTWRTEGICIAGSTCATGISTPFNSKFVYGLSYITSMNQNEFLSALDTNYRQRPALNYETTFFIHSNKR